MAIIPYNALRKTRAGVGLSQADKRQVRNMDAIPYGLIDRSFADDFDSSTPDPFWATARGSHQGAGVLHTTPVDGPYTAQYWSVPLDARGKSFVIEAIPNGVLGIDRFFSLQANTLGAQIVDADQFDHDSTTAAQGGGDPDSLSYGGFVDGAFDEAAIPFDPIAHRWWRIRTPADGSASFLDVSPDGLTWTNLGRSPSTWDRSHAYLNIGAGQYANPAIPTDTDVQWANLSIYTDATPYTGRIFMDDFDGPTLNPFWNLGAAAGSQSGGFAHTPVGFGFNANFVAGPLDLRGKSFVIEAIPDGVRGVDRFLTIGGSVISDPPGWAVDSSKTVDQIEHDSTSAAQGGQDPDTLTAGEYTNGYVNPAMVPYDPVAHRWWRLRVSADGSASFFDVSPDGLTWTNLGMSRAALDRSHAYITFGAGQYASPAIPVNTDAKWDNFSIYIDAPPRSLFTDDFDGDTLNSYWTVQAPQVTVGGGVLHMLTGRPPGNYAQMVSGNFDARGKECIIEATPHAWNGSDSSDRDFQLVSGDGTYTTCEVYQDTLYYGLGGVPNLPYDPVAHRWFKLAVSADGSSASCYVSPDGVTWTLLITQATIGHDWTTSHVYIDAGNDADANTDVQWDNFSIYD